MPSAVNLFNQMNIERRDLTMLHALQHQFAYNRSTDSCMESPIDTPRGV